MLLKIIFQLVRVRVRVRGVSFRRALEYTSTLRSLLSNSHAIETHKKYFLLQILVVKYMRINTIPNWKSLWPLSYNVYNTTCHLFLRNIFHRYARMALVKIYKYEWNVAKKNEWVTTFAKKNKQIKFMLKKNKWKNEKLRPPPWFFNGRPLRYIAHPR